ncbi:hypothetical protein, partial [Candidatus Caldatribacterium sp.]|uniref:hypothetical protein n=1 Tax=Candidatus Caldatribacterium sp. TaxID=2282143 RepID=UPI0038448307|nr:hypothetical protein [Candidatus Caldatribacterium sp.]
VYEDAYERNRKREGGIRITLTFDEDIVGDWSCILNKDNWTVTVKNSTRQTQAIKDGKSITPTKVEPVGTAKNKIRILASVVENRTVDNVAYSAYGLICNEGDAEQYGNFLGLQDYQRPSVADTVTVKLKSVCDVYDALGNNCCGLQVEACCAAVCEPVQIPTGCPLPK